jgi:hypothetical protein
MIHPDRAQRPSRGGEWVRTMRAWDTSNDRFTLEGCPDDLHVAGTQSDPRHPRRVRAHGLARLARRDHG